LPLIGFGQVCETEKVDIEGCLIEKETFMELVERLCKVEANLQPDTNTEYKHNLECNDGVLIYEVFSSDGNTDSAVKIDLEKCLDIPEPCTQIGLLESDNNISEGVFNRAGNIGTSNNYARCDHQHPIVRLPNPGDPVPIVQGSFLELQNIILDRGSTEECYWWRFRIRVSQDAGNNWGWIAVPTIAGFQQPVYTETFGYMTSSSSVQDDDNAFGATARGPTMAYPINHWSSTNRLYGGYFRRDNDINSIYVNFVATYCRN